LYELHVEENQMKGEFPSELLQKQNLRRLSMGGNRFSGPIPTEIGTLTDLESLSIHSNDFTGTLPSEIGSLRKLVVLDAYKCKLSGVLPSELGYLTSLVQASLYDQRSEAKFTGPLPPFDTNPFLSVLYLSRNSLQGTIPANLLFASNRTASINIDLSYNQLAGSMPIELGSFDKLNIDLVQNAIDGLPPDLCDNLGWMEGVVGLVSEKERCDAILCSPGTASKTGRMVDAHSKCVPCPSTDQAPFYGSTSCLNQESQLQRELLIELYKIGNGKNWINTENWLTERQVCSWFGLTCDDKNRVIGLKLENNRLTTVDEDFGLMSVLSRLRFLEVSANWFSLQHTTAVTHRFSIHAFISHRNSI
jgi:Leucine-rich repeat (LRR) protein